MPEYEVDYSTGLDASSFNRAMGAGHSLQDLPHPNRGLDRPVYGKCLLICSARPSPGWKDPRVPELSPPGKGKQTKPEIRDSFARSEAASFSVLGCFAQPAKLAGKAYLEASSTSAPCLLLTLTSLYFFSSFSRFSQAFMRLTGLANLVL